MTAPLWILMPVLDCWELTFQAIKDCLAQSVPTRILVINNGSSDDTRHNLERVQASHEQDGRVLVWHHDPPLPSLSATWNRALDFVWDVGGEEALVVNNDVRLNRYTCQYLMLARKRSDALFVTATGVREGQYRHDSDPYYDIFDAHSEAENAGYILSKGGPDFSCFLITQQLHKRTPDPSLGNRDPFRFDESLIPCYTEDLDYHRRLMLAGLGQRIFSINLPFLHYASQTINRSPEAQAAFHAKARQVRAIYARKWGGPPNEETFDVPYGQPDPISGQSIRHPADRDVRTPTLFDQERRQWVTVTRVHDSVLIEGPTEAAYSALRATTDRILERLEQRMQEEIIRGAPLHVDWDPENRTTEGKTDPLTITPRMHAALDKLAESVETTESPFARWALGATASPPSPTDSGPRSPSSTPTAPPTSLDAGSGPDLAPAAPRETADPFAERLDPMDDPLH